MVGQARLDEERRVWDEYKYDDSAAFEIKIDDEDFISHSDVGDSVFLVSYQNIAQTDCICIENLINDAYFSHIDNRSTWISNDFVNLIVDAVSDDLKDYFWMDDVKIYSMDAHGRCTIGNAQNKIPKSSELHKFFNESVIHVIKFVILIEAIGYFQEQRLKPLLVLDDCFNSLDHPNRTFMMKFLLGKTKGIQKIIFTHNTGFYNLFSYIAKNVALENNWKECQLTKVDKERFLLDGSEKTTSDIKKEVKTTPVITVGNDLRKRFEILVYKLSRLNNIGELQETKDLLDKMCQPKGHVFLSTQGDVVKDIYALVDEIYANVTNGNDYNLAKRLKEKIDKFRNHSFLEELKPVLVELRLLQKVALHQTSHGHRGVSPASENEIDVTFALLEKLERAITSVSQRVDVSSI